MYGLGETFHIRRACRAEVFTLTLTLKRKSYVSSDTRCNNCMNSVSKVISLKQRLLTVISVSLACTPAQF